MPILILLTLLLCLFPCKIFGQDDLSEEFNKHNAFLKNCIPLRGCSDQDRFQAISAIVDLGKPAVPMVVKEFESSNDQNSSEYYIHSLTMILGQFHDKSTIPVLLKRLDDEDPSVVGFAVEALCKMRDEKAIRDILRHDVVKIKSLMKSPPKVNEQMDAQQFLETISPTLQTIQASMYLEDNGKDPVPMLMKIVDDENEDIFVRVLGMQSLVNIANDYPTYNKKTLIGSLINHLSEPNEKIRIAITEDLKKLVEMDNNNLGTDQHQWQQWWETNEHLYPPDEITPGVIKNVDKVIDLENSTVMYELPTTEGEKLLVIVEYKENRPNPSVYNVALKLSSSKPDGDYKNILISEQKHQWEVLYSYFKGRMVNVRVVPDITHQGNAEETIKESVVSVGGNRINFTVFYATDGSIENISITPDINPFNFRPEHLATN